MRFLVPILVFLLTLVILLEALPFYRRFIPNGFNVPDPCNPTQIWPGVGHRRRGGGGPLNNFGRDFWRAGIRWTRELCEKDSDGDGLTNGQELGDPLCQWSRRNMSAVHLYDVITHPGIDNRNPECVSTDERAPVEYGQPECSS